MYKYGFFRRNILKFVDLLRDPRNPLRVFQYLFTDGEKYDLRIKSDIEVKVSITVDVEHDFGIPSTLDEISTMSEGIENLLDLFAEYSIEGTFFVSGSAVEYHSELVEEISDGHEVGVHGYDHECWSEPKWWLGDDRILDREQKEVLLKRMVDLVGRIASERPRSFRAPYMAADMETLKLLDELNFEVDSSAPSYYGVFPRIRAHDELGLKEVPISADPEPSYESAPFPHFRFNWLNMKLASAFGPSKTVNLVEKILSCQVQNDVVPHLVMLLHQWEFAGLEKTPAENSRYATKDNKKILGDFLEELDKKFDLKFLPIRDLAEMD